MSRTLVAAPPFQYLLFRFPVFGIIWNSIRANQFAANAHISLWSNDASDDDDDDDNYKNATPDADNNNENDDDDDHDDGTDDDMA